MKFKFATLTVFLFILLFTSFGGVYAQQQKQAPGQSQGSTQVPRTPAEAAMMARSAGASEAQVARLSKMSQQEYDILKQTPEGKKAIEAYGAKAKIVDGADKRSGAEVELDARIMEAEKLDEGFWEANISSVDSVRTLNKTKIFGHELFSKRNLTFAPSLNIAPPANYILSSGDELYINLWGAVELEYTLKVAKDGTINIPNVGFVPVAGLTIAQAEQRIKSRLVSAVDGLSDGSVNIKISLGEIRAIKVNIIGEASLPGTYTLSSLSTLFNALYVAGGPSEIGSIRNIKLYRAGKQIAVLDVYDYLLNGKQDVDVRLEDNDMIIVEPYNKLVGVSGYVKRPRIFELKDNEPLGQLINYAGGYKAGAFDENLTIRRKGMGGLQASIHTVERDNVPTYALMDGDSVTVEGIDGSFSNKVVVDGAVWRAGEYELGGGVQTVGELVRAARGLRDNAFLGRAQLFRVKADGRKQIISLNLGELMEGRVEDVPLYKNDSLVVRYGDRMDEDFSVRVYGEVLSPVSVAFNQGMTVADLIMIAGGLKESAALSRIEVARRVRDPYALKDNNVKAEMFTFEITDDAALTAESAEFKLEPYDIVYVRRSPGYQEQLEVSLRGEVIFPGNYVLTSTGDRLTDLLRKSGGFTQQAYIRGAFLKRKVTEDEQSKAESLKTVNAEALGVKVEVTEQGEFYSVGIDLEAALRDTLSAANLVLQPDDILFIPNMNSVVRISGAVQYPNTVSYVGGAKLSHYISQAGGYTKRANRKNSFVVYMNGTLKSRCVLKKMALEPGCEIVVPTKPDRPGNGMAAITAVVSLTSALTTVAALVVSLVK